MEPRDTLLLVDDQQADRAVLRELFQEEYNLLEAENGDQALLLLEENHTRIAAVLLDLLMPAKDGFTVLAEMRAKRVLPETPVVVITAQDSAARAARAFELGASDFIVKPFEPCAVRRRVRNLVELSRYKRCLEELAEEQANALRQSNEVMVDTLSSIIEYRGAKSGRHILRIRRFTKLLLEELARSCPEYQLDGRKIAVVQSYRAKAAKSSKNIEAFGESEPVATIEGQKSYTVELTRLYATDTAISDGIDFYNLTDFSLVICKPDRKVIYSGCEWSGIQEDGELNATVAERVTLTAARRIETTA